VRGPGDVPFDLLALWGSRFRGAEYDCWSRPTPVVEAGVSSCCSCCFSVKFGFLDFLADASLPMPASPIAVSGPFRVEGGRSSEGNASVPSDDVTAAGRAVFVRFGALGPGSALVR
jgi:hypothetical protein